MATDLPTAFNDLLLLTNDDQDGDKLYECEY